MSRINTFKRRTSGLAFALLGVVVPLATAQADHCGCGAESLPGRMTGGGSVINYDGLRVTHGFQLNCDIAENQSLEMNWGNGDNFHLTNMVSVTCSEDPDIDPGKPVALFDTLTAVGEGLCNGVYAEIIFTFQDAGEPGFLDYAEARIWGCPAGDFLAYGLLDHGNQQAHME